VCVILLYTNSVKSTDEARRRRYREAGEREFREIKQRQRETKGRRVGTQTMCVRGLVSLFFMPGPSPHCAHCPLRTPCDLWPLHIQPTPPTTYSLPCSLSHPLFFSSLLLFAWSLRPVSSHHLLLWALIHDCRRQFWTKKMEECVGDLELGFPVCQQGSLKPRSLPCLCVWACVGMAERRSDRLSTY